MAFGHNSKATYNETTYHVQTEDRGVKNPFIDTMVYCYGRVIHRRTNSYYDLLPLTPEKEEALRQRVDAQHKAVVEEIHSGGLQLGLPPEPAVQVKVKAPIESHDAAWELQLELLNPRNWLTGRRARLELAVHIKGSTAAVASARIEGRIEGAANPAEFTGRTGPDGHAVIEFDMPRSVSPGGALLIQAAYGIATAKLRFQLRPKPASPSAARAR